MKGGYISMYIPGCGRYDNYTSRFDVYLFTLRDYCEMLLDKFGGTYIDRSDMPVHTGYLLRFVDVDHAIEFITALANSPKEPVEGAVTDNGDGKTFYILPHLDGNELPLYATTIEGIDTVYVGLSEYHEALDEFVVVSKLATPWDQTGTVLGKNVSDLQTAGTRILEDGTLVGNLKYVEGFTAFSSKPEEQNGHYFAFKLNTEGSTMTLKMNGKSRDDKTDLPFDPELLFRIDDNRYCDIEVDGSLYMTVDFSKVNLIPAENEGEEDSKEESDTGLGG